ncbi:accessory Sec system translocase SecA2 [Streptococcus suis]|uniref:accessory Sec system translocase SecA2 n=1 Tax=Streptococcus suis TaxID=1307 RepID=UPI00211D7B78|nr:accessory Sec system translocase SecA2 [Streptococcus suis]UUM58290.1 accessory Sec system translocase SecA2 [Streptococcus suis]
MNKLSSSAILNSMRLAGIRRYARKVNKLRTYYSEMTDEELQEQTILFKKRLLEGEGLDDLMVEAFAVCREACYRILGKFPYDVQVMGAIALHQGNIAEMKTGEGKTLTATMPLYLNGLSGKGAILVTTNDYLAKRDAEEMGEVYRFLGLTVGVGVFEEGYDPDVEEKRAVYAADITYTTGTALGFDYLMENLASSIDNKFMREFHFVIVDEADAVLLDIAQTPLIISGSPRVQSNLFDSCNQFVLTLKEEVDFYFNFDKREVYLTEQGMAAAEKYFAIEDLYDETAWELNRQINLALRAHYIYRRDYDYIVHDDEVKLLDNRSGRILEGTRLQSGIHQAIESKEGVTKTQENRAMGSVTYQSLFNMFPTLSGMTGTGREAEDELIRTYKVPVIAIPTNLPIQRIDYPDKVYATLPEKIMATMEMVKELHEQGRPILLISGSVDVTKIYSQLLLQEGIAHNTLTANNVAKEALIIQEAGQYGMVTCATVMAGRGTDIKLGPGVAELGGLAVIGTERMANSRMDGQLRGRAGRQGEPGMSQFFVSLEDELLVNFGPEWVKRYLRRYNQTEQKRFGQALKGRRFRSIIKTAQIRSEDMAIQSRHSTVQFDESMRVQRNKIYDLRNRLMQDGGGYEEKIQLIFEKTIQEFLDANPQPSRHQVRRYILDNITYSFKAFPKGFSTANQQEVAAYLQKLIQKELNFKKTHFQSEEELSEFYRVSILKAIDECWVEEVDSLQQLKGVVNTRVLAQRNNMYEYYKEALHSYGNMTQEVHQKIARNILLSTIETLPNGKQSVYYV